MVSIWLLKLIRQAGKQDHNEIHACFNTRKPNGKKHLWHWELTTAHYCVTQFFSKSTIKFFLVYHLSIPLTR
ncbi:hypothetical protein RCL_jg5746.t1 [Rhizophagus clarus]|uniref:Uncharacterized protein n=1 Tax=Rhizophagus clarus TaxID=94130 RepID=A0A8H3M1E8_9GLOM|nr:hypothetical protein RCL_jg5746.t1 [Rhizophagus clarus]